MERGNEVPHLIPRHLGSIKTGFCCVSLKTQTRAFKTFFSHSLEKVVFCQLPKIALSDTIDQDS